MMFWCIITCVTKKVIETVANLVNCMFTLSVKFSDILHSTENYLVLKKSFVPVSSFVNTSQPYASEPCNRIRANYIKVRLVNHKSIK